MVIGGILGISKKKREQILEGEKMKLAKLDDEY